MTARDTRPHREHRVDGRPRRASPAQPPTRARSTSSSARARPCASSCTSPVEISCILPVLVNTELAAGASQARFVAKLEPTTSPTRSCEDAALPALRGLRPGSMSALMTFAALLPRAAREAMARALRADRVFMTRDDAARRDYEQRAARSETVAPPCARSLARRTRATTSSSPCTSGRPCRRCPGSRAGRVGRVVDDDLALPRALDARPRLVDLTVMLAETSSAGRPMRGVGRNAGRRAARRRTCRPC